MEEADGPLDWQYMPDEAVRMIHADATAKVFVAAINPFVNGTRHTGVSVWGSESAKSTMLSFIDYFDTPPDIAHSAVVVACNRSFAFNKLRTMLRKEWGVKAEHVLRHDYTTPLLPAALKGGGGGAFSVTELTLADRKKVIDAELLRPGGYVVLKTVLDAEVANTAAEKVRADAEKAAAAAKAGEAATLSAEIARLKVELTAAAGSAVLAKTAKAELVGDLETSLATAVAAAQEAVLRAAKADVANAILAAEAATQSANITRLEGYVAAAAATRVAELERFKEFAAAVNIAKDIGAAVALVEPYLKGLSSAELTATHTQLKSKLEEAISALQGWLDTDKPVYTGRVKLLDGLTSAFVGDMSPEAYNLALDTYTKATTTGLQEARAQAEAAAALYKPLYTAVQQAVSDANGEVASMEESLQTEVRVLIASAGELDKSPRDYGTTALYDAAIAEHENKGAAAKAYMDVYTKTKAQHTQDEGDLSQIVQQLAEKTLEAYLPETKDDAAARESLRSIATALKTTIDGIIDGYTQQVKLLKVAAEKVTVDALREYLPTAPNLDAKGAVTGVQQALNQLESAISSFDVLTSYAVWCDDALNLAFGVYTKVTSGELVYFAHDNQKRVIAKTSEDKWAIAGRKATDPAAGYVSSYEQDGPATTNPQLGSNWRAVDARSSPIELMTTAAFYKRVHDIADAEGKELEISPYSDRHGDVLAGTFVLDNDKMSGWRPVYRNKETDTELIYVEADQQWVIGQNLLTNVAAAATFFKSSSRNLLPHMHRKDPGSNWQQFTGGVGPDWTAVPDLRVRLPAPNFATLASTDGSDLGTYERITLVGYNGTPIYINGTSTLRLAYTGEKWVIGADGALTADADIQYQVKSSARTPHEIDPGTVWKLTSGESVAITITANASLSEYVRAEAALRGVIDSFPTEAWDNTIKAVEEAQSHLNGELTTLIPYRNAAAVVAAAYAKAKAAKAEYDTALAKVEAVQPTYTQDTVAHAALLTYQDKLADATAKYDITSAMNAIAHTQKVDAWEEASAHFTEQLPKSAGTTDEYDRYIAIERRRRLSYKKHADAAGRQYRAIQSPGNLQLKALLPLDPLDTTYTNPDAKLVAGPIYMHGSGLTRPLGAYEKYYTTSNTEVFTGKSNRVLVYEDGHWMIKAEDSTVLWKVRSSATHPLGIVEVWQRYIDGSYVDTEAHILRKARTSPGDSLYTRSNQVGAIYVYLADYAGEHIDAAGKYKLEEGQLRYTNVDNSQYTIQRGGNKGVTKGSAAWTLTMTAQGEKTPVFIYTGAGDQPIAGKDADSTGRIQSVGTGVTIDHAIIIPFAAYTLQRPYLEAGHGILAANSLEPSAYDGNYKVRPAPTGNRAMYTHTGLLGITLESSTDGVWRIKAADGKIVLFLSAASPMPYGPYPPSLMWQATTAPAASGLTTPVKPKASVPKTPGSWDKLAEFAGGVARGVVNVAAGARDAVVGGAPKFTALPSMTFTKVVPDAGDLVLYAPAYEPSPGANVQLTFFRSSKQGPIYTATKSGAAVELLWAIDAGSMSGWRIITTDPSELLWSTTDQADHPIDIVGPWTNAKNRTAVPEARIMAFSEYTSMLGSAPSAESDGSEAGSEGSEAGSAGSEEGSEEGGGGGGGGEEEEEEEDEAKRGPTPEEIVRQLALAAAAVAAQYTPAVKTAMDSNANVLKISGTTLTDDALVLLSAELKVARTPVIQLDLSGHTGLTGIEPLQEFLKRLPHLQELNLTSTGYDTDGLIAGGGLGGLTKITFGDSKVWRKDRYRCDVVNANVAGKEVGEVSDTVRAARKTKRGKHTLDEQTETCAVYDPAKLRELLKLATVQRTSGIEYVSREERIRSLAKAPGKESGDFGTALTALIGVYSDVADADGVKGQLTTELTTAWDLMDHVARQLHEPTHGPLMLPFGGEGTEIYAEAAYPAYPIATVQEAAAVAAVQESLARCLWSPADMKTMSLSSGMDVPQLTAVRLVHALGLIDVAISEGGTIMWEAAKEKTIQAQRVKMWAGIIGITDKQLKKIPTAFLAYAYDESSYYGFIVYEAYTTNGKAARDIRVLKRQSVGNTDGPLTEIELTQGKFDEHVNNTLTRPGSNATGNCANLTYIVDAGFGDEREGGVYSASGNVVRLLQVINSTYYYLDAAVNYKPDTELHRTVEAYAKSGFVNVQHDGRSLIGVSYEDPYAVWEVPMVTTRDILADVVAKARGAVAAAPLPFAPPAGGGAAVRKGSHLDNLITELREQENAAKPIFHQGRMKRYAGITPFPGAVAQMITVLESQEPGAFVVAAYLAGKGPGDPYSGNAKKDHITNMKRLADAAFRELTSASGYSYTLDGMEVEYFETTAGGKAPDSFQNATVNGVPKDDAGTRKYTLTLKGGRKLENVDDNSIIPVLPGTSVST
jgi:hypothetical protein